MAERGQVLVVGAGFAGAVHARVLAEHGFAVHVIDRRSHVAGNAHDTITADGTRVHTYGPHLFHTNDAEVVQWITQYGDFENYEHRVLAEVAESLLVPLPINRRTINKVFSLSMTTADEVARFLEMQAVRYDAPRNAAEFLYSRIGMTLTDLFFRPYTKKMWELDLEDMHESVVKRIPLRYDDDDRYFPNDKYQILPKHGYTKLFETILDHSSIYTQLNRDYEVGMEDDYRMCFSSMPIDEYYEYQYGALPYRSIRFHHRSEPINYSRGGTAVVNFTDSGPYTRETDWSVLPMHQTSDTVTKTITVEEPCDYKSNYMERYYPVRTSDDRYKAVYDKYAEKAKGEERIKFIGRCGTYQYLDMHQVINQSLMGVRRWILHNTE